MCLFVYSIKISETARTFVSHPQFHGKVKRLSKEGFKLFGDGKCYKPFSLFRDLTQHKESQSPFPQKREKTKFQ